MRRAIRAIWNEQAAPDPPPPTNRDWVLTGVIVLAALVEASLRSFAWKPGELVFVLAVALALPWRRTHPLAVAGSAFAGFSALNIAASIAGASTGDGIYAGIFILMLPYTLLRWGSGRDWAIGLSFMLITPWTAFPNGDIKLDEAIGGSVFLLLPAAVGASIRYRDASRERAVGEARLHERELLARELHDTVAHHVSAIAIQAQAGRTVAGSDPAAATRALDIIEGEASRTLAEMRTMVGVLRRGEAADMAPQPGVADIARLATESGVPRVRVEISGDLGQLRPSVDAAMYRLAQESITNARRHARNATTISVQVSGDKSSIRLTVHDDGEKPIPVDDTIGFGLAGMAERAKLLGGSFTAGPHPSRGWHVEAVVPRTAGGS